MHPRARGGRGGRGRGRGQTPDPVEPRRSNRNRSAPAAADEPVSFAMQAVVRDARRQASADSAPTTSDDDIQYVGRRSAPRRRGTAARPNFKLPQSDSDSEFPFSLSMKDPDLKYTERIKTLTTRIHTKRGIKSMEVDEAEEPVVMAAQDNSAATVAVPDDDNSRNLTQSGPTSALSTEEYQMLFRVILHLHDSRQTFTEVITTSNAAQGLDHTLFVKLGSVAPRLSVWLGVARAAPDTHVGFIKVPVEATSDYIGLESGFWDLGSMSELEKPDNHILELRLRPAPPSGAVERLIQVRELPPGTPVYVVCVYYELAQSSVSAASTFASGAVAVPPRITIPASHPGDINSPNPNSAAVDNEHVLAIRRYLANEHPRVMERVSKVKQDGYGAVYRTCVLIKAFESKDAQAHSDDMTKPPPMRLFYLGHWLKSTSVFTPFLVHPYSLASAGWRPLVFEARLASGTRIHKHRSTVYELQFHVATYTDNTIRHSSIADDAS
ncbi:hypothetical protein C8F01DRAFT_1365613 [Mycena amicta]|nr:hypothetical protein C8F01DRAFT_1365613 [Mycena amicta]